MRMRHGLRTILRLTCVLAVCLPAHVLAQEPASTVDSALQARLESVVR